MICPLEYKIIFDKIQVVPVGYYPITKLDYIKQYCLDYMICHKRGIKLRQIVISEDFTNFKTLELIKHIII